MKVLVVGYPKTGTKTMYSALTRLGYKCYDYSHNYYYLGKEWIKILTEGGTKEDFYNMFKDVDACVDTPATVFWENILEAFPDTKLIFMERKSEEEYFQSLKKTLERSNENLMLSAMTFVSPTAFNLFRFVRHMEHITLGNPPSGRFYRMMGKASPLVAKRLYRLHKDSVMRRAPKEQLLKFNVREGWEPLCKFLGVPVPSKPFPYKNKSGRLMEEELETNPIFHQMKREAIISLSLIILAISMLCIYGLLLRH